MTNELLIVAYVGIADIDPSYVVEHCGHVYETLVNFVGGSGKCCVVPVTDSKETRIECINPTFISGEEIRERTRKQVEDLSAKFKEMIDETRD